MIFYNTHKHLLQEQTYSYSLQDVAEPNLYRDVYEYTEIPKIVFNNRRVPSKMPEERSMAYTPPLMRPSEQGCFSWKDITDARCTSTDP